MMKRAIRIQLKSFPRVGVSEPITLGAEIPPRDSIEG